MTKQFNGIVLLQLCKFRPVIIFMKINNSVLIQYMHMSILLVTSHA